MKIQIISAVTCSPPAVFFQLTRLGPFTFLTFEILPITPASFRFLNVHHLHKDKMNSFTATAPQHTFRQILSLLANTS